MKKKIDINFEDNEILKDENVQEYIENISQKIESKEAVGFIGKALVYDEEIFINTYNGGGFDRVITKMKQFIEWHAGKIKLDGFDKDDLRQLIVTIILDGIKRYNPNLKIKLSTFLYVHVRNRLISKIKKERKQASNATYHNPVGEFTCPCGNSYAASQKQLKDLICDSCNSKFNNLWRSKVEHFTPVSLDNITSQEEHMDKFKQNFFKQENMSFSIIGELETIESMEKSLDISKILSNEDEITRKIADLVCNNDYSLSEVAKTVGLTCWAASLRLKKLKNNKQIKEFFLNK